MRSLKISDFTYNLPAERIALFPLSQRDQSKLLVYKQGQINHAQFSRLTEFLPSNSLLFFNDTKVIPARIHFKKQTGADIEIFLLSPVSPSTLHAQAMQTTRQCSWECTIGNLKRWVEGTTLQKEFNGKTLEATRIDKAKNIVTFKWTGDVSFAEVISNVGETPLPPYLKRKAESSDRDRYQTVYSHYEGAVAAPTAGLHFTDKIFQDLTAKGILYDFLTLHVSAGTFQPVKTENANEHTMHHEQIVVSRKNIDQLLAPDKFVIPVGTTSMRTLESIYWFGVKLLHDPTSVFLISQNEPYRSLKHEITRQQALEAVKKHMQSIGEDTIHGETSIFIKPGYQFRICEALITNFHQPASTLLLLVAAFIGEDWKKVYAEALENNYRFLSYGDSSLLIPRS